MKLLRPVRKVQDFKEKNICLRWSNPERFHGKGSLAVDPGRICGIVPLTARKGHSKLAVGSNHVGRKPDKPGKARTGNCSLIEFLDS